MRLMRLKKACFEEEKAATDAAAKSVGTIRNSNP
jgi:hypothetical protein